MINKNIVGGVSPLKARASKGKAGKVGIKATNVKAQRKSGFTESGKNVYNPTGAHNLESLTGNTRVGSSLVDSLKLKDPGTGTGSAISGKKDFGKVGKFGETGSDFKSDPDVTTSERKSGGTFDEVWDANKDNFQDKWGSKEEWKIQAQKEIDAGYYSETKTVKGQKYQQDWKKVDGEKVITKKWYKID